MQFNTYSFVLAALPLTVAGYFLLAKRGEKWGRGFLIFASLVLYAFGGWQGLCWLLVSILVNALLMLAMGHIPKWRRTFLVLGILFHVGLLVVFKYLMFGAELVNMVMKTQFYPAELVMPLGISFFTFQQIAYLVDESTGKHKGYSFWDYLLYVVYFPKLVMGPIARAAELVPQFHNSKNFQFQPENFAGGIQQFTFGLFKKAILAETFSGAVGFLTPVEATSAEMLLIALAYTFQIYFDFSGYSDMAIGFSRMLNITLPMNFDSPYKALSIRDFWKRWHMSLTAFLTEYIYFPLGGSRKGKLRTYVNTIVVFLISGLWHGASLSFVVWGLLNGLLSVFERITERYQRYFPRILRWAVTFCAINVLWLLFQTGSTGTWLRALAKILRFSDMTVCAGFYEKFLQPEVRLLLTVFGLDSSSLWVRQLVMGLTYGSALALCLVPENTGRRTYKMTAWTAVGTALLLVFCLTCLTKEASFVYNQF